MKIKKLFILLIASLFKWSYSLACTCAPMSFCQSISQHSSLTPTIVKAVILPGTTCDSLSNEQGSKVTTCNIKVLDHISGSQTNDTLTVLCYWLPLWCSSGSFASGDTLVAFLDTVTIGQHHMFLQPQCYPYLTFKNDSVTGLVTQTSNFSEAMKYSDFKNLACISQVSVFEGEKLLQPQMIVSPNPASSEIKIIINNVNLNTTTYSLQLIDALGKKIELESTIVAEHTLNISFENHQIDPGFYTLLFSGDGAIASEKLVYIP